MNIKRLLDFEFFKTNKKTVIFLIIGLLGIMLIFASEFFENNQKKTVEKEKVYTSYSDETETKLADLISKIQGAGKTKVFLTIEESEELVYAQNTVSNRKDENQESGEREYVIIDGENGKNGLLIKRVNPKVRGVAIVCEGGDDPVVQQKIYSCVSASLGISTARISISKMSTTEVKNEK